MNIVDITLITMATEQVLCNIQVSKILALKLLLNTVKVPQSPILPGTEDVSKRPKNL